ncbi:MAG: alkane 1-monooxygenase [Deltaproteobacteria bacterium]|nr:MAG: alkane 1-monooxygenase [Deltaproteobacteria bacterium]
MNTRAIEQATDTLQWGSLKYLAGFVIPAVAIATMFAGGAWTFATPAIIFLVLPLLEFLIPGTTANPDADEERALARDRIHDWILYATVPVQWAVIVFTGWAIAGGWFSAVELVGVTLSVGMCCGVLGINAAHELGHRRKVSEQRMSKALLLTSLYMHFFIEHNRGHHAHVATDEDPASARRGEWLQAFFVRSVIFSWLSAWRLERERLERQGRSPLTLDNEMLRFQLIQFAYVLALLVLFGPLATLVLVGAAIVGFLLLENVNYIEHYGLRRQAEGDGYERTLPIHSWNSNHPLGRVFLFELTRHSDHHAHARRRYQVLRHFDESPQLPAGYPAMMLLAWFPPLWFAVMHRHIDREEARVRAAGLPSALQATR